MLSDSQKKEKEEVYIYIYDVLLWLLLLTWKKKNSKISSTSNLQEKRRLDEVQKLIYKEGRKSELANVP